MNYDSFFAGHLRRLHNEGRYRVFAELERLVLALMRKEQESRPESADEIYQSLARLPLEGDIAFLTPGQQESGAGEDSPDPRVPGRVTAGQLVVEHVPLLRSHAGTPPDMVLTWNAMESRAPSSQALTTITSSTLIIMLRRAPSQT